MRASLRCTALLLAKSSSRASERLSRVKTQRPPTPLPVLASCFSCSGAARAFAYLQPLVARFARQGSPEHASCARKCLLASLAVRQRRHPRLRRQATAAAVVQMATWCVCGVQCADPAPDQRCSTFRFGPFAADKVCGPCSQGGDAGAPGAASPRGASAHRRRGRVATPEADEDVSDSDEAAGAAEALGAFMDAVVKGAASMTYCRALTHVGFLSLFRRPAERPERCYLQLHL